MLTKTDRSHAVTFAMHMRKHDCQRSSKAKENILVRRTATIAAVLLLLVFFTSLARTDWLEMASQSVTKSEGTISREIVVTTEGINAPPRPKGEAKPEAKPLAKPEAKPIARPVVKPEGTPVAKPEAKPQGPWSVQVKASQIQSESLGLAKKLKNKGYDTQVVEAQIQGRTWYRVRVGHLATKQEAQALLNTLKSKEGFVGAFLVGP